VNTRFFTILGFLFLLPGTAFSFSSAPKNPFALKLDHSGLRDSEILALGTFLKKAEALLPLKLKESLSRVIYVRFTTLDGPTNFVIPYCAGDHSENKYRQIRGQVSDGLLQSEKNISLIELNSAMIPEILAGSDSTTYNCGHKNLYKLALATLLHEVSHIYDFAQIGDHGRTVSDQKFYQSIMGWEDQGLVFQDILPRNLLHVRSPDVTEFKNIEENFAVNMEYFLLDPEFGCRRPSTFQYFNEHFGFNPFPSSACSMNRKLTYAQDMLSVIQGTPGAEINLDPDRIYEVHYLFAGKGSAMMSRWGHSMYRLIVCNSKRTEVGPECLNDINDHVALTFIANTGSEISYWRGLFGGYASRMELNSFYPNVVNEYTIDEFRELKSVPLKLSADEKRKFVNRVLEMNWEYAGRFYFLTNNCSDEALAFLKGILPEKKIQELSVMSPLGLYEDLADVGLTDTSLLDDQSSAKLNGYYFESKESLYQKAFQKIKEGTGTEYSDLDDFVSNTTPMDRLALYVLALFKSPQEKWASRFFIIESYITRLMYKSLMTTVLGEFEKVWVGQMNSQLDTQWTWLVRGYGIPMDEDSAAQSGVETESHVNVQAVFEDIWKRHQPAKKDLDESEKNRSYFLEEIKKRLK
jgi:hypothetical protein